MKKLFFLGSIIAPLLIGGALYMALSPEVFFSKITMNIYGLRQIHFEHNFLLRFVRFYFLDMLWAYSLVFALSFAIGNEAECPEVLILAAIFSVAIEVLQKYNIMPGTYDWADIIFELLAEIIAAFIIKNIKKEERDI